MTGHLYKTDEVIAGLGLELRPLRRGPSLESPVLRSVRRIPRTERHEHLKSRVLPHLRNAGLTGEPLFNAAWSIVQHTFELTTDFGQNEVRELCEWFSSKDRLPVSLKDDRKTVVMPKLVSCRDLLESEISLPKFIIKDLLPEGLSLLVAKPKAGKSWFAQNLALSIAQGSKALGHFLTEQSATLNLCLEDNPRRMRERLSLMLRDAAPPDNHLIACEWPPFDKGGIDYLQKILENRPDIKLVTIDTFGRFRPRRGRTDDIYSSDYADLQQLHSLSANYEIGILLVHHSRKETSEDAIDNILGSTALSGAADSLLILKRKSRMDAEAVLYVSGRDIRDQELALSFDAGVWSYKGNSLDLRLTAERRAIRSILKDAGKPLTPTEVATVARKTVTATHNLLSRMVDAGEVAKSAQRGKYMLPPEDELYGEPWKADPAQGCCQEEVYLDHI